MGLTMMITRRFVSEVVSRAATQRAVATNVGGEFEGDGKDAER